MTTLGAGISDKCRIHDGITRCVKANLGWKTFEGPVTHGSRRIVKSPALFRHPFENRGSSMAEKERRKVASPLRCFTDNDMVSSLSRKPNE